ncbi:hypothetical protein EPUS_01354 [Endocarpon pusillum Z07020]|uniref:FAD-binding PCMH-type domain-containing protein n=1 Tax=Endocarpon pusillum (strain Z07020 / HMAS-L-300199) TaxID=1263415 RepID=U1GU62_ENDPU|nr:uncharacterized protein EPUS_01354 [Endocarpon pusillum Z07020]ERF75988.1 hypothetical protein EPUS_01354 [Endocarpon pusillum Z07020]
MNIYLCLALAIWASTSTPSSFARDIPARSNSKSCRNLAGDEDWPSSAEWAQLNDTVHGRLIATKPLAQSCHVPTLDATECANVKADWTWPDLQYVQDDWLWRLSSFLIKFNNSFKDPASIMNPYWLNNSCSPFTSETSACTLGNIVDYTINVTSAKDVAAGIDFAQKKNIRLVIKNTGHDFLGRSTGKGALGLWTHNLKDISFSDYNSSTYTGRAVRMGAGVQAFEAYEAADVEGVRIMGGSCPTVGLSGGYTQGAGHGPLNGAYGLAADNTLEWEVVTAEGEHLVATPEQHSDLYWALSGGGGGTYAVVLSLTTKAHPDSPVAGATMQFNSSDIPPDTYWDAVHTFHEGVESLVESPGMHAVWTLTNTSFFLNFVTWPDHTAEDVEALLEPFRKHLKSNNIPYHNEHTYHPSFYSHYSHFTPALPYGAYQISLLLGGRLIPLSTVENNNAGLTAALRNITQGNRWVLNGLSSNLTHARVGNKPESNAVLPAWRDSIFFFNVVREWDPNAPVAEGVASENELTREIVPQLERITPGSGTYINEGDFNLPTWKEDYFGANYDKLLAVKKKYDPMDLFYAIASVGSDAWTVASDGRLCRAK